MLDTKLMIQKLEIQGLIRTKKITGNYMTIYCPFHNNGQEKKPSCGILLQDEVKGGNSYPAGFFHCFSCGYANDAEKSISDILDIHDIPKTGVEWLSENIPGYDPDSGDFEYLIPQDDIQSIQAKYAIERIKEIEKGQDNFISETELAKYRYTVPYMYERKLTDEIIAKFDIGFDPNFNVNGRKIPCITFPVADEFGNVLFIYRRSIQNKFHNYPLDVLKPVYGLNMIPLGTKEIIICESIINALTLWTYGFVAVALMGTGNVYQIKQLRSLGVLSFVLCMDGDDAGARATAKLYKQLSDIAMIWKIDMIPGEDVNSIEEIQFRELYQNKY